MKIHRFFQDFDSSKNIIAITDGSFINQVRNVLRMKDGDVVELFNKDNCVVRAEILGMKKSKKSILLRIREEVHNGCANKKNQTSITLFMCILKRENFELVVQKTTEIGVTAIVPVLSKRTIKSRLSLTRLQRISTEAAEQCGRETIPIIYSPCSFNEAMEKIGADDINIMFDKNGVPYKESLVLGAKSGINIFVGPEGGWDESEIYAAKKMGFVIANLGDFTLRAETAAIIAVYILSKPFYDSRES